MSCIRIKSAKRQSSPIRPSVSVGNVMYPDTLPPPGHLIFNADFESGNLGRADKITTSEYDLFIRPDTLNNKYRVWFYFECKNALENQRKMSRQECMKKARETKKNKNNKINNHINELANNRKKITELTKNVTELNKNVESLKNICNKLQEDNNHLVASSNKLRSECASLQELNKILGFEKKSWKEEALNNKREKERLEKTLEGLICKFGVLKSDMANLRRSCSALRKRSPVKIKPVDELSSEKQRVIFNIVNFSKQRSLFENGVAAPVVKLNVQHSWSRIPSRHIYYYRSAQHSDRWILSFAFIFDSSEPVKFAYCIPYTYTDLQKWLCDIEARNYQFFRRDVLTYTIQKRQIDLITVESTADNLSTAPKKMIVITARVHPGETPSSHVLHGFLEFLVSSDERAQKLRKVYCFKIIPMLNPDGVCLGNYRCSLMGNDLNRMWRVPSDWAHPSIFCVKNLLQQYDSNPQINIIMYIDLHAHSQKPNCFLYGNLSTQLNNTQMMRLLWLPHILAELSDDYSLDFTQFNTDAEKAGTGRRTMGDLLSCICYTMEVSFFSYKQCESSGLTQCIPYLQYKYESLGEALCKSILNFYEIDCGIRDVSIQRAFKTFLPARAQKGLKQARQMIKTVQTLSKHA